MLPTLAQRGDTLPCIFPRCRFAGALAATRATYLKQGMRRDQCLVCGGLHGVVGTYLHALVCHNRLGVLGWGPLSQTHGHSET
jgi:hypothetical protein